MNKYSKLKIWHYGSNDPNRNPYWLQDGVAPQCAVKNIDLLPSTTIGGRAYIPKNITIPNGTLGQFEGRHSIFNYGWIFTLSSTQKGYVKQR